MKLTGASSNRYRIQVAGHLDDHWSSRLGGHRLTRNSDGTTTLTTATLDQAQLHGTLMAVRDIGAALLGVERQAAIESTPAPSLARTLTTERLTLRPATAKDAASTWHYRRLREVNEWLDGPLPDLETYAAQFSHPGRLSSTVIVERRDHSRPDVEVVVGDFMLRLTDSWAQREVAARAHLTQAELGWALDPAHTGYGYATEAVLALLHHSFSSLGVHRVTAESFLDNEPSWRLMERVGMRREAHSRRDALHRSGRWLDSVTYAALADEWRPPDVRRRHLVLPNTHRKEQS